MPEKTAEKANGKLRKRPSLTARLSSAAKAIQRSFSPIPKYPYQPTNAVVAEPTGILEDIQKLGFQDIETLLTFLNAAVTGVEDDNNLLLEHLIQLLAKLPSTSVEGKKLEDGFINQLWSSLDHPPVGSLAEKYKYREADGSNNNIRVPDLGAANTPYARSTAPVTLQSPNPPDPADIFDTLLARGDTWNPHPNKISSVLFYLATIIIHDIFQTVSVACRLGCAPMADLNLNAGFQRLHDQQNFVVPRLVTAVWPQSRGADSHAKLQERTSQAGLFLVQADSRLSAWCGCYAYHVQPVPQLCGDATGKVCGQTRE